MADESGNRRNNTGDSQAQEPLNTGIVRALPERLLTNRAYLLGRLGREARRRFTQIIGVWDLTASHYGVLLLLEEIGQASQQHLAQTLSIDRANMVALLDVLERRGFIERSIDPRDRRRHVVKLTVAGREELRQIRQAEEDLNEEFFGGLDKEEQEVLHELLVKLFTSLIEQESTRSS
jgi:DNA-binding MarR family transcriptional regulator